jgi:putative oxidoreductase
MENSNQKQSKALNIALWGVQLILAAFFMMAAFPKLTSTAEELSAAMPWVRDVPFLLVQFIGACEFAGASGLIFPSALRIKPRLTVIAAAGLALIMVFASAFHITRGEYQGLPVNAVLLALTIFVVWGRSTRAVIVSKDEAPL